MDDHSSGAAKAGYRFDIVRNSDKTPHFFHVGQNKCRHLTCSFQDGQVNEHMRFVKKHYVTRLGGKQAEQPLFAGETLFQEVTRLFNPIVTQLGFNDFDDYLTYCEKCDIVLQGSAALETANPTYIQYSPHVDRPGSNERAYVRTSAPVGLYAHRNKFDRVHYYNWTNPNWGKRATLFVIEGKYRSIFSRVGLSHNNTTDLASTLLPIPVRSVYEVIWRSWGVHDAIFHKVRMPRDRFFAMFPMFLL